MKSLSMLASLFIIMNCVSASKYHEKEAPLAKKKMLAVSMDSINLKAKTKTEIPNSNNSSKLDTTRNDYFYICSNNSKPDFMANRN